MKDAHLIFIVIHTNQLLHERQTNCLGQVPLFNATMGYRSISPNTMFMHSVPCKGLHSHINAQICKEEWKKSKLLRWAKLAQQTKTRRR